MINLNAQQWVKMNPSFNPSTIGKSSRYSFFIDSLHGWWSEAFPARIWHTHDGGNHWSEQINLGDAAYRRMFFADTLHGWIIGGRIITGKEKYYLMRTTNGGKNWDSLFIQHYTKGVFFFDSSNGFAYGRGVYKTTNGGTTWDSLKIQPIWGGINAYDLSFQNTAKGWMVGARGGIITDAGYISRSIDSGKTWQMVDTQTTIGSRIIFVDSLIGYIVGSNPPYYNGVIKKTTDGGESWSIQYIPTSWLEDVVFIDDKNGWAVGDYGYIVHTTDGGENWFPVSSGSLAYLYNIFFFNKGRVGYVLGDNGTLLRYVEPNRVDEKNNTESLSFKLSQNYPNPFNPTTIINYEVFESGKLTLKIFNLIGEEISTLVDKEILPGSYSVVWNAKNNLGEIVNSGIYLYTLRINKIQMSRKLIFLK